MQVFKGTNGTGDKGQGTMAIVLLFFGVALVAVGAFVWGAASGEPSNPNPSSVTQVPVYSSGYQDAAFFERAYEEGARDKGQGTGGGDGIGSALVAHHLLVADKIAGVFERIATEEPVTLVLVGPNHFSVGKSAAQVSMGTFQTPFGDVEADTDAIAKLLAASAVLKHEELAQERGEHSLAVLTPFIKHSLPNAKIVPILVHDKLSADDAWELGRTIGSAFPGAILVASVDMAHYMDAERTAAVDAQVLGLLDQGLVCSESVCTETLEIDSNASLRVLGGFNFEWGLTEWHLTHHGSALEMGATRDPASNTSHVLGYFTKNDVN